MVPALDLAAELLRHRLLAVADAENRHARLVDGGRSERRVPVEHRGWAAGEDHAFRPHRLEGLVRLLKRHDFAIDLFFAHSSRDELGHLRTEIDDQNLVVAGEPIGIGAAHEGGIKDGHPDLMCGAPRVRSRPLFPPAKPAMIRPLSSSSRRPCNSPSPLPAAKRVAFSLSAACCTRCNSRRLSGSISDRRWHWSPCWRCIDRGKCACGPFPPTRPNISGIPPWETRHFRSPWVLLRGWEPARPRPERRRLHRCRTGLCGNRANSVRRECPRTWPLGTWRCIPSS